MKFLEIFQFTVIIFSVDLYSVIDRVSSNHVLQRNIRSPDGLFGNRQSPLSLGGVGDRLKPVTFGDIFSMQKQITDLSTWTNTFGKLIEQEKLARNFLEKQFETAKQKVTQLRNSVNPDAFNFWASSIDTCGGVLTGQTGKISYKENQSCDKNERCIWTVRVNQRSKIKLRLPEKAFTRSDYGILTIREINLNADQQGSTIKRVTENDEVFLFDGPLIIITFVTPATENAEFRGYGFSLDFEGIGSNIDPPVHFTHFHLTQTNGTISYPDTQTSPETIKDSPDQASKEIITFVINPEHTETTWLSLSATNVGFNEESCGNTSLYFYPDLVIENSEPEKCCSKNCKTDFTSFDGIFFVNMVKDVLDKEKGLSLTWNFDKSIEPVISKDTCGGFINFTSVGKIMYKDDTYYNNNERCVWVVHSNYKNQITLQITDNGLEDDYDFLTVTEMQGVDFGEQPRSIQMPLKKTAILSEPDILITFYSDNTQYGTGFVLTMEAVGLKRNPNELKHEYFHFTQETSKYLVKGSSSSDMVPNFSTIVINPIYPGGNSLNLISKLLELQSEQVKAEDIKISVYGSNRGLYDLLEWYNGSTIHKMTENGVTIKGMDGIAVVRYENTNVKTDLELQWEKGTETTEVSVGSGEEYIALNDNKCGGFLAADAGKITYKMGDNDTYEVNERCTWIIMSQTLSKITLKLEKDGFESCCDYLIVRELDEKTGTLKNLTTKMSRLDNIKSFGNTLLVTFISDKSEVGKGFILSFESGGSHLSEAEQIHWEHKLLADDNGTYSYPDEPQTIEKFPANPANFVNGGGFIYVVSPILSSDDMKVHLTLDQLSFEGVTDCSNITFTIHSYDFYNSEEYILKALSEDCNSESKVKLGEQLKSMDKWFVIIFKFDSLTGPTFKFHWEKV